VAVSPSRAAAFEILLRVEREQAYAVELLHSEAMSGLSSADQNLTMEIVMGVLRWQPVLDATFAGFVPRSLRKLDLEVLTALRMGAYQLAFLSRIPAHAVVNESVELVKLARKKSAAGMVNAVMRKMEPRRHAASVGNTATLAVAYAHPEWLVEKWVAYYGFDITQHICSADQQIPSTTLRLSRVHDTDKADAELATQGVQLAPGKLMRDARVVVSGDIIKTQLLRGSGAASIQDEGSQLIAALVGSTNAQRILDCCAAPGGKTAALAARLPQAQIVAVELHRHRARLLRKLVPQENVSVIAADARNLPLQADFACVLVDAPCSGTGTLARNPEIKWRLKPQDLADLQARQIAILSGALRHVAPGGRLVYSTCSLEPEENEHVVDACLQANRQFRLVPVRDELLKLQASGELVWSKVESLVSEKFLRTIPGVHPCDGFFAAIFERH
jgi:16S rRNA (cytosine967-C5)-methyltransferase